MHVLKCRLEEIQPLSTEEEYHNTTFDQPTYKNLLCQFLLYLERYTFYRKDKNNCQHEFQKSDDASTIVLLAI